MIKQVYLRDFKDELNYMFLMNFIEGRLNTGGHKFDLDIEMLRTLEVMEYALFFGAFEDDKLIGYIAYLQSPNIFCKGEKIASVLAFYVDKNYTDGWTGYKLLRKSLDILKINYKISTVDMSLSIKKDFGSLVQRLGFKESETIYRKKL